MAKAHCVIAQASTRAITGSVAKSVPVSKETITTSGTSQATTIATPAANGDAYVWQVTASGGNIWVKFAASPTASAGNDWLILDGQTREFGASVAAEKVAVIDAS